MTSLTMFPLKPTTAGRREGVSPSPSTAAASSQNHQQAAGEASTSSPTSVGDIAAQFANATLESSDDQVSHSPSPTGHKPTKIFIISDTHEHDLPHTDETFDVAICLGDTTKESSWVAFRNFVRQFSRIKAPNKFMMAGNHEFSLDPTFDTDEKLRKKCRAIIAGKNRRKCPDLLTKFSALRLCRMFGIKFLDKGTHVEQLENGTTCQIYADPYTPHRRNSTPGFKYKTSIGHVL